MKRVMVLLLAMALGIGAAPVPAPEWHVLDFVERPDGAWALMLANATSVIKRTSDTRMLDIALSMEKPESVGSHMIDLTIVTYRIDCAAKTAARIHAAVFAGGKKVYDENENAEVRPVPEGSDLARGTEAACAGNFATLWTAAKPTPTGEGADWFRRRAALEASTASGGWYVVSTKGVAPARKIYVADKSSLKQVAPDEFEIAATQIMEADAVNDRQLMHWLHIDCRARTAGLMVGRSYHADGNPSGQAFVFRWEPAKLEGGSDLDLLGRPVCSGDWHGLRPLRGTIIAYAATAFARK